MTPEERASRLYHKICILNGHVFPTTEAIAFEIREAVLEEREAARSFRTNPRRLMFAVIDSLPSGFPPDALDRIWEMQEEAMALLCAHYGHEPIEDQCGMPMHDYCAWCRVSTPGQAKRHAPVAESQAPACKAGDAQVATEPGAPTSEREATP